MIQQALDLRDESDALAAVLSSLSEDAFERPTRFKGWTPNNIIRHLHAWNWAAVSSMTDLPAFQAFLEKAIKAFGNPGGLRSFEAECLGDLKGHELLSAWQDYYREKTPALAEEDPERRVPWAGPEMSVQSSISARLMETWSHGQAIYDEFGLERVDTNRIHSIAQLGVMTFGFTFKNRGLPRPEPKPRVTLTAPSGAIWEWNGEVSESYISGAATEFCQVVAQTRNVADTALEVVGDSASEWMAIAQCFAGSPEDPPAPGERRRMAQNVS